MSNTCHCDIILFITIFYYWLFIIFMSTLQNNFRVKGKETSDKSSNYNM